MIYTVTVNPSLDYVVEVNAFEVGMTNRTVTEGIYPGGKGINVAVVLRNLGFPCTALGFVAGFTGRELERLLGEKRIFHEFITVDKGFTRINFKLKSAEGTEINGQGPQIEAKYLQRLMERLEKLEEGDVLCLAGSIPASVPQDLYRRIMERLEVKGILTAVDATGELLTGVLSCHPFLVKPNHHELGEIFGVKLETREAVIPYMRRLQEMGARNVLVSMAGKGSVLLDEKGQIYSREAPQGRLVNGVGAGDSMVAGFLAGWLRKQDYEYAYRLGAAAGSASAFSEELATEEEIEEVLVRTFGNN